MEKQDHPYADILHLPHHISNVHPRMSMNDRAAQFSPFAALVGYEDIIDETQALVREILAGSSLAGEDWPDLKNRIKDDVHQFIFDKIKRNPMILPIILDV